MATSKIATGEVLVDEVLDNGLQVFVLEKPGFHQKYAVFATKYGSIDSKFVVPGEGQVKVPDGIAHFLEHKLFEEEQGNVFDRFSQYGASVNAFTSYTMTAYLFATINYFEECLTELLTFVQTPYLTEENVDKEKGIIEQELKMFADHPNRRVYQNLLKALYHYHPIRSEIGGTIESIYKIDVDLLMKCYNTFYHPSNMALFVVGDVEGNRVIEIANQALSQRKYGQSKEIARVYPTEPSTIKNEWVEDKLAVSRSKCYLGFKMKPEESGKKLFKQQMIMNILWKTIMSKSSLLHEKLYNERLIGNAFRANFSGTDNYAFAVAGGETDDPYKLAEVLRNELSALQKTKIPAGDVDRIKQKLYGSYLGSLDSLDYIANSFLAHHFNHISMFDFLKELEAVTVDDVNDSFRNNIVVDEAVVSVLLPS